MQTEMYATVAIIQEWPFYEHILPTLFLHCEFCYVEEITEDHAVILDVKDKSLLMYAYWINGKVGQYIICCVCKPLLLQRN